VRIREYFGVGERQQKGWKGGRKRGKMKMDKR